MSSGLCYRILINIEDIDLKKVLKTIHNGVSYNEYEFTTKFIKLRCIGQYCIDAGLQKFRKEKIEEHLFYDLYFFRDEEMRYNYFKNAPAQAHRILNKNVKRGKEPFIVDIERPTDMFIIAPHELNTTYKGYFCRIDMHSAEPYFLSKELPELERPIKALYKKRKVDAHAKLTLVCLNGICRNEYASVYLNVVNKLYNKMVETVELLQSKGLYPFYIARDGLIVRADKKKELEAMREYMDIGKDLGQWDMSEIEQGTITTGNVPINFKSNLSFQKNIQIGKPLECEIMHIQPIFDKLSNTKYIIHENLDWRKKDITELDINWWG